MIRQRKNIESEVFKNNMSFTGWLVNERSDFTAIMSGQKANTLNIITW